MFKKKVNINKEVKKYNDSTKELRIQEYKTKEKRKISDLPVPKDTIETDVHFKKKIAKHNEFALSLKDGKLFIEKQDFEDFKHPEDYKVVRDNKVKKAPTKKGKDSETATTPSFYVKSKDFSVKVNKGQVELSNKTLGEIIIDPETNDIKTNAKVVVKDSAKKSTSVKKIK